MKFNDPVDKSNFECIKGWLSNQHQKSTVECGSYTGSYSIHRNSPLYRALEWLIAEVEKQPTLPAEPTDEMLIAMIKARYSATGWDNAKFINQPGEVERVLADHGDKQRAEYKAIYALLTAPLKPKTIKKWCCAWRAENGTHYGKQVVATFVTEQDAINNHDAAIRYGYTHVSPVYEVEVPVVE